jgi:pimeloyl-ACP methyl ester carboxylesterase
LNLLHNYQANLAHYDEWHRFFRDKQPKTLIVWGRNDPFFTVEGAQAYLRDIPKAELNLLDTGHFALEDSCDFIAQKVVSFFA